MNTAVDHRDTATLLQSINKAESILHGMGIYIDLNKEMPSSGSPDYFMVLRRLNSELWAKVYAHRNKKR